MEIIMETLFDTPIGLCILGGILLIALIIQFFNNKPQI